MDYYDAQKTTNTEEIIMGRIILILALIIIFAPALLSQPVATDGVMTIYPAAEVKWQEGPPALNKGARMAILEGDPTKEGLFTIRLRLPDGFSIQPHFHSQVEHVTVLSGAFNLGMGEKFDKSAAREMPTGTFGFWPAGMKHFAWAKGDTVLQVHGTGPWTITYINAADDPRKKP